MRLAVFSIVHRRRLTLQALLLALLLLPRWASEVLVRVRVLAQTVVLPCRQPSSPVVRP